MTNVIQVIKSVFGFDNVGNKSKDSCQINRCQVWVPEQVSLESRQSGDMVSPKLLHLWLHFMQTTITAIFVMLTVKQATAIILTHPNISNN